MSWNFKSWRRRHTLKFKSVPDDLWQSVVARLHFLRGLTPDELERLHQCVTLFLQAKHLSGAGGLVLTEEMRVMIAAQACILILNLDLDYYDGWVEIIVYPGEFIYDYEYTDEDGVVHSTHEPRTGESWLAGPVILSWEDVADAGAEAGVQSLPPPSLQLSPTKGREGNQLPSPLLGDGSERSWPGYNVVIHEFAHKLDMLNGDANGFPTLHADMSRQIWSETFSKAYADFCAQVDANEETAIDPYAAENPAEFFAVLSETFFETPLRVKRDFPVVYEQLVLFYRQDPAERQSGL